MLIIYLRSDPSAAGQTHSPAAAGAFCVLREGLDSADVGKFPESKSGAADVKNKDWYLAICAASDAVDNPKKTAYVQTKTNSGTWKEKTVTLTDANFGNRCPNGADLMLVNPDAEDDIFHLVELARGKPTAAQPRPNRGSH